MRKVVTVGKLTDKQHKKIIALYAECQNYSQVARKFGVSVNTIKRHVNGDPKAAKIVNEKKEQNTQDILAYMESQKNLVCQIIGLGLEALAKPDKFTDASPSQITTALGTIIDKWAAISGSTGNEMEEDALSRSLKELAEGLESDDQ